MENLALVLASLDRFDEAVAFSQRAVALDPLRSGILVNFSIYLGALGRYDEAEADLHKAIALQPQAAQNYMQLTKIQILQGRPADALASAKREIDPFFTPMLWRWLTLPSAIRLKPTPA